MEMAELAINYVTTKVRKWNLPNKSRFKFQRRMPGELTKDARLILPKTSKEKYFISLITFIKHWMLIMN